ncbi:hypothetical protein GGD41_007839 [Paraburkholderia bryophila]|uniref:Helicase C-terminal domain-containing protein n=2 Tax=Paraburkholderia TaxID=1822464 RepID=A0A7Z0B5L9_9BURK|nr:hypothetical protein [Paraburkholderia bryophila]
MDADQLAGRLADAGFESAALHGDLPQGARNRTIKALRERRVRVLVATDVAARGIDIPGITHVFNYDLPKFAEDYVHRIGRTGRAGRTGTAVSLVHHAEQGALKRIERFVRTPLPVNIVVGFEPRKSAPSGNGGRPGFGGRGRPGGGNGGGAGRRFGSGSGAGKPAGNGGGARSGNGGGWAGKSAGGGSREGGFGGGSREGGSREGGFGGGSREGYGGSRDGGYGARRSDGPRTARRGS